MNKNLQQFLSTLVQAALRNAMPKGMKDEGKRKKGKQGEVKSSADPARAKG